MSTQPRTLTRREEALRHPRVVLVSSLFAVAILCWAWIISMGRDMYGSMNGPAAWMMTSAWDAQHLVLLWAMWVVMMIGMMLPSISPTLLLYAGMLRPSETGSRRSVNRVYLIGAGYLVVWVLFGTAATALQRMLTKSLLLTPMMELSSAVAAAAILLLAGSYQLTPLKRACLRACRSPLSPVIQHWHGGRSGAFRMGLEHGGQCLGCCWALMLLLFVGGVMNLYAIAAITALVLVEKLVPGGDHAARVGGVSLIGLGVWLLAK